MNFRLIGLGIFNTTLRFPMIRAKRVIFSHALKVVRVVAAFRRRIFIAAISILAFFAMCFVGALAQERVVLDVHAPRALRAFSMLLAQDPSSIALSALDDSPRLFYFSCSQMLNDCAIESLVLPAASGETTKIKAARDRQLSQWRNYAREFFPNVPESGAVFAEFYQRFVFPLPFQSPRELIFAERARSAPPSLQPQPVWMPGSVDAALQAAWTQSLWAPAHRTALLVHLAVNWGSSALLLAVFVAALLALLAFAVRWARFGLPGFIRSCFSSAGALRAAGVLVSVFALLSLVWIGGGLSEREALAAHPTAGQWLAALRPFEVMSDMHDDDAEISQKRLACPRNPADGPRCLILSAREYTTLLSQQASWAGRTSEPGASAESDETLNAGADGMLAIWTLPPRSEREERIFARDLAHSLSWPASAAWKSEFIRARAREALSEMDWSPHHATRTRMEEGVWWAMRLALFLAALLGLAIGILLLLPALAAQAKAGFLSAQNAVQKLERAGSDLARASEARALRRIVDEAAEARGAKDSGAASQSRPSRRL